MPVDKTDVLKIQKFYQTEILELNSKTKAILFGDVPFIKKHKIFHSSRGLRLTSFGHMCFQKFKLLEFTKIDLEKPLNLNKILVLNRESTTPFYISPTKTFIKISDLKFVNLYKLLDSFDGVIDYFRS